MVYTYRIITSIVVLFLLYCAYYNYYKMSKPSIIQVLDTLKFESKKSISKVAKNNQELKIEYDIESIELFGDIYVMKKVYMGKVSDYKVGWIINNQIDTCMRCNIGFNMIRAKHHCRLCGYLICSKCSNKTMKIDILLPAEPLSRICRYCYSSNNLLGTENMFVTENSDEVYSNVDDEDDVSSSSNVNMDKYYGFYSRSYDPNIQNYAKKKTSIVSKPSISSTNANSLHKDTKMVKFSEIKDNTPNIAIHIDDTYEVKSADLQELRKQLSLEINQALSNYDCQRFLKARSNHILKAVDMIKHWYSWWNTTLPGTIVSPNRILEYHDEKQFVANDLLLHSNIGEDREGNPIYWEKTGAVSANFAKVKTLLTEDEIFVRHIRQQEYMMTRLNKASVKHKKLIEKQVIVSDMKSVSMSLDFMALRLFRRTMEVDASCYPERVKVIYMINAPYTFTTIWTVVKPWIDPVTVKKIKIVGTNYLEVLKKDIDLDQIPIEYGGTRADFAWTYPDNREK